MSDDDEFEWIDVTAFGGKPQYVRGKCLHRRLVPVELSLTGEAIAALCLSCDSQLPADLLKELT